VKGVELSTGLDEPPDVGALVPTVCLLATGLGALLTRTARARRRLEVLAADCAALHPDIVVREHVAGLLSS